MAAELPLLDLGRENRETNLLARFFELVGLHLDSPLGRELGATNEAFLLTHLGRQLRYLRGLTRRGAEAEKVLEDAAALAGTAYLIARTDKALEAYSGKLATSHPPVEGSWAPGPEAAAARAICSASDEVRELLLRKNRSYGNSALDPMRVFSRADRLEQLRVRIDDKLSRLARGKGDDEDTELDLIGYLVLLRAARRMEAR